MSNTPSLIERAAHAAQDAILNPALRANISIECDDPTRVYETIVLAALEAIREPSEAMVARVQDICGERDFRTAVSTTGLSDEEATAHWQAMIDAALSE